MSGRSWKFESSHGHEKQKSANSRFFFALPLPFSCFCFPHTTLSCPSLSSKKSHDNTNNKDNISFLFQKCCPRLSIVVVKKTRQHRQQRQHFLLIPKSVVQGCPSLSSKKNHLFMKIFIFVSENIKMFCLGNISLSLKSTIRFFLIRISPIQCVKERDGGLRSGSINDGLFHLLMFGNVWVKSLTNLVQCVTE